MGRAERADDHHCPMVTLGLGVLPTRTLRQHR